MKIHNRYFSWNLVDLIILITFLGAIIWQLFTPMCVDDYVYSLAPVDDVYNDDDYWMCLGNEFNSFSQLIEVCRGHFLDSNMRLSNLLFILVQMLPLWIVKTICGLSIGLMFWGIFSLAIQKNKRKNPFLRILALVLFWGFFPWYDVMQASDYIFNYPVASCFLLFWLKIYESVLKLKRKDYLVYVIFTVFVGFYHEGFTIPLGCFVFGDLLINNLCSKRKWFLWAVLLACIMVVVVWSPKTIVPNGSYLERLEWDKIKLLSQMALGFIALFTILIYWLTSRTKSIKSLIPYAFGVLGAIAMCMFLLTYGRAFWGGLVFAMILILKICANCLPQILPGKLGRFICCICVLAYVGWFVSLIYWQSRIYRDYTAFEESFSPRGTKNSGVIFHNMTHRNEIPFYLRDIPSPIFETSAIASPTFARYWQSSPSLNSMVIVLPENYKDTPYEDLPSYPGNATVKGEWPYLILDKPFKGHIYVKGGDMEHSGNPFAYISSALKPFIFKGNSEEMWPYIETRPILLNDSTEVHAAIVTVTPLSFGNRKIVQIDTIAH